MTGMRWREAAVKGRASDFIETLPAGYRTQLGKWFKDGRELSGGQWQKIALSRAFMRSRADVLVLDEPTAAMDAQAEAEVFEHFRQLARERITILISHRFSTVRMADQIVVLNSGHITERGSHESDAPRPLRAPVHAGSARTPLATSAAGLAALACSASDACRPAAPIVDLDLGDQAAPYR
jgi:ABC-type bacteriocin/lantibiotic exporter with double-glycine peptidase domain